MTTAQPYTKAVVLGDGGWGTTLALVLHQAGVRTTLWSAFPEQAAEISSDRENKRFLPGVPIPDGLEVTADPFAAAEDVDIALSVVPTQFLRSVLYRFEDALKGTVPIVSATKGIEIESFRTPTQILREQLGERPLCVLSGPSHAEEVARGLPASVVVASTDESVAARVQASMSGEVLRVYTSDDPIGAQLGGALKNVIAVAAGMCDGLELGDNAKAALLTRGIVEMARFGVASGAKTETFFGLAGLGDLIGTCCSQHSRNRMVGERLGRGESLKEIVDGMKMVAEGVWTTQALFGPESEAKAISMPIAEQVNAVLFEGKLARDAATDLMRRSPAVEMDGILLGR